MSFFRRVIFDEYKGAMNFIRSSIHMLKTYHFRRGVRPVSLHPMVVFMVDRNFYSGGMADRFKGAVTAYAYCKQRGYDFRIRYIFPFELSDYLLPAQYDWRLKDGEYSECILDAKVMYARAEHGRRLLRQKVGKRQLHFYGNYDNVEYLNEKAGTDYRWGELFLELFRPCPALEQAVSTKQAEIGAPYISVVFRFQNLLGDFREYKFSSIDGKEQRERLISTCLEELKKLQRRFPDTPFLVTSDSSTFAARAADLPGIHTVGGERVHIGSGFADSCDTYMNSFIDFFMLAGSQRIFNIVAPRMYPTNFPVCASRLHDVPFERIYL